MAKRPYETKLEVWLNKQDAEILRGMARHRGCSVAELVREAIYATHRPLRDAYNQRIGQIADEIVDASTLARWTGRGTI